MAFIAIDAIKVPVWTRYYYLSLSLSKKRIVKLHIKKIVLQTKMLFQNDMGESSCRQFNIRIVRLKNEFGVQCSMRYSDQSIIVLLKIRPSLLKVYLKCTHCLCRLIVVVEQWGMLKSIITPIPPWLLAQLWDQILLSKFWLKYQIFSHNGYKYFCKYNTQCMNSCLNSFSMHTFKEC